MNGCQQQAARMGEQNQGKKYVWKGEGVTSARDDEWNRNIESKVGKVGSWFSSVYQKDCWGGFGGEVFETNFSNCPNADNVFVLPF